METPDELKYAASHEWVRRDDGGKATVGISAFAQDRLGELVYVELPKPGAALKRGDAFGVVESTKAASDVYAPVSGTVLEVNSALADQPQLVNESPYDSGWLVRIQLADAAELNDLLSAEQYRSMASE